MKQFLKDSLPCRSRFMGDTSEKNETKSILPTETTNNSQRDSDEHNRQYLLGTATATAAPSAHAAATTTTNTAALRFTRTAKNDRPLQFLQLLIPQQCQSTGSVHHVTGEHSECIDHTAGREFQL